MADEILTSERLRELFDYNPLSGNFYRIRSVSGRGGGIGQVVKSFDKDGYLVIGVDCRRYFAHRLAWIYVNGSIEDQCIDHINGVKSDNRIENLRLVSVAKNNQNLSPCSRKNNTGYACVWKITNTYRYDVTVDGHRFRKGNFPTAEDAHMEVTRIKKSFGYADRF